mgnify:CR=1 FL=1
MKFKKERKNLLKIYKDNNENFLNPEVLELSQKLDKVILADLKRQLVNKKLN